MSFSPLESPVVVDGIVSDERLSELLALQAEYPELDYKSSVDLQNTGESIELAKDVGAMQVRGGYIVVGVDGNGRPTGGIDGADPRRFDEANLTQKMLRYLPQPLELRTRIADRAGHRVVLIYVGRHPSGCAIFTADGTYIKDNRERVVFRAGDAFWRDGTRSTRMTQQGFEELIARRIGDAKTTWLAEQRDIRRQEREDLETAYQSRRLTEGPLGSVNLDMDARELDSSALEFIRTGDTIGLQHLTNDAIARARGYVEAGEIESELGALLDKLACLAATFLDYGLSEWFERIVDVLRQIYSMPLGPGDAERFGFSGQISPAAKAPRVWLQLMTRVFGIGALAVRRRQWPAVRTLTLQLPDRLMDYETNWLRHALTMLSRARHLQEQHEGRTFELSLLNLARADVTRLECLRTDGPNDEEITTSLAQFDILSNIVAVVAAPEARFAKTFYPNFARFRQSRVQPLVELLLTDEQMRSALGVSDDASLASALNDIGGIAHQEGLRFDGFETWAHTPVGDFISQHLPRADELSPGP